MLVKCALKSSFQMALLSFRVQACFQIMDMCHSWSSNAVFDALNQNTIHFSRPPLAPTASSGIPLAYSNIPIHNQVRIYRAVCFLEALPFQWR